MNLLSLAAFSTFAVAGPVYAISSPPSFLFRFGSLGDGDGRFNFGSPIGLTRDSNGNIYATDVNQHVVNKFNQDGCFLLSWGGRGIDDGKFESPLGIDTDSANNLYVVDRNNLRVQVFNPNGQFLRKFSLKAQNGVDPGSDAWAIAINRATDKIYVTHTATNHYVARYENNGTFELAWGATGAGNGQFINPSGITVDPANGEVYVSEANNNRVQVFTADGDFLRTWGSGCSMTGEGNCAFPQTCEDPDGIGSLETGDGQFNCAVGISMSHPSPWTLETWTSSTLLQL